MLILMATIEKRIKGQEEKRRLTHIYIVMANTNSLKVEAPSTSDQLVNKLKINKYTYPYPDFHVTWTKKSNRRKQFSS